MAKICTNCWMPAINGTEHKVAGKNVCHDCVVDYKLTPDPKPKETEDHAD